VIVTEGDRLGEDAASCLADERMQPWPFRRPGPGRLMFGLEAPHNARSARVAPNPNPYRAVILQAVQPVAVRGSWAAPGFAAPFPAETGTPRRHMSDDLWDDTMSELAEMLGSARVIQEAVPFPLRSGTIYARSGTSWSILSVRTIGDARALLMGAGLLAQVPVSMAVHRDMVSRTARSPFGAYLAIGDAGSDSGALVFKGVVPYDLLGTNVGPASRLVQQFVSATVNAPEDLISELSGLYGGRPFTFEDRGYIGNLVF
jgi:hypothetical protein